MELSPHINARIKASYPFITFGLLFSLLLFEAYPVQVPFERGIEIVKSRGYELIGDVSLARAEANLRVSEKSMTEFLRLSEATRSEDGVVLVFSDMDARVLFLVSPDSEEGQLIVCRFR
ncbi:MAG: hypothetical protein V3V93_04245 [bacterium]